ncbi:MAG: hypothetical protein ACRC68_01135 [Clostridium sp.]
MDIIIFIWFVYYIEIGDDVAMIYFLKHYYTLVAIIDLNRKVMEIEKPNLFTDRMDKLVILGSDLDKWIENRVTPGSQKGFNKLVAHLGIDENSESIFTELLIATKGVNVKDRLWLTNDEFDENSPWNNLLDEDYDLIQNVNESSILSHAILNLIQTRNRLSINMDGACEKTLIRLNGDLAICKKATQNNTCDSIMEEVIYNLGISMGLDMAPAGYLGNKTCYSVIDENIDLIMACDLFKRDDLDYEYCYRELRKMKCDKQTLTSYLRMLLFDIITRQIDRNSCNFGFYKIASNNIKMYRLYDNGLSLFAHNTSGLNRKTFATRLGNSEDIMEFAIKELKRLGIKNLFKKPYKSNNLYGYLNLHKEEIENTLGVNINEIVSWSDERYKEINSYTE